MREEVTVQGDVEQYANHDIHNYHQWLDTAPPDDPDKSVQCPQCSKLTWRYSRHCIHCQLDLRAWTRRSYGRRIVKALAPAATLTKRTVLAIAGLVMASCSGEAAAQWAKEVTSFRGVEIGADLSASFPECPRSGSGTIDGYLMESIDKNFPHEMKGLPCYTHASKVGRLTTGGRFYEVRNLPPLPGLAEVALEVVDGRIEAVESTFSSSNFDTLKEAVIEKYGAPTSTEARTLTNAFGKPYSGRSLIWQGSKVIVTLDERRAGFKETHGFLTMTSRASTQRAAEQKRSNTKAIGSGL